MITSLQASRYIIALSDPIIGGIISNLRLQKLLYYSQGTHLNLYQCPLFKDTIKAGLHGPSIPVIDYIYGKYDTQSIDVKNHPIKDMKIYTQEEQHSMDIAFELFGQYSAWKLKELSCNEAPYKTTALDKEIPISKIQKHFKTLDYIGKYTPYHDKIIIDT